MVMVLHRRIGRVLRENKARYLGILFLIFLGSFAFVCAKGFGDNYGRLVERFAEDNRQEDLSFSTDKAIDDLASLERAAGATIEPYRYADCTPAEGMPLRLISPCERIDIPAVKSGRNLEGRGEILVDPFFASQHGLAIGDAIPIGEQSFEIVGTVALPHYVYPLKYVNDVLPPSGFGIGLVSNADLAAFPDAQTVYAVRIVDRQDRNAQATRLHAMLGERAYALSDWVPAQNNKRIQMPWATISGAKAMCVPLPIAMFLLSCLIIGVMIGRMVRGDGVVIGTLYALGYRRKEVTRHYMAIPLLLSALGGLLGVLLALPCIAPIVSYMAQSYYNIPLRPVAIAPLDVAVGILLPVVFLGAASWLVIRKELKKTAANLMKGDEQKAKTNRIERSLRLDRFPFHVKFQLREQLRSLPRLAFLFLGVMGASVLMLFGFTINNSMQVVFESGNNDMYNFAYEYSFKQTQHGSVPAGAEPFNAMRCYPEGREEAEFYLTGIPPESDAIRLQTADGSALPKDQVNITYPLAHRMNLRVGDTLTLIDKLSGQAYDIRVDGIAQTYAGQFVYMPLEAFNAMIGEAPDAYSGLFGAQELEIDESQLAGVKNLAELSSGLDEIAMPMTMVVVSMTIVAGLMGAIILFLVTSLIVDESRITISLLKVFGYRGKELRSLVLNGTTPVVILGFCAGLPVMLACANAIYTYLGNMINLVLPMIVNPLHVAISFALIFGVYELTKRFCGRKIVKVPMRDALKAGSE